MLIDSKRITSCRLWFVAFTLLIACGGRENTAAPGSDGNADGGAARESAATGGEGGSVIGLSAEIKDGDKDSSAADASGYVVDACASSDGACVSDGNKTTVEAGPPPTEVPSFQTVTFRITNVGYSDRFVAMRGWYCTPHGIDSVTDIGVRAVALQLGFECRCECPNPGKPYANGLHRLRLGETYEIVWDARQLITYTMSWDCAQHGWPQAGVQQIPEGVLQPVGPGRYQAVFGVEDNLPDTCPGDGPDYSCDRQGDYGFPPSFSGGVAPVCSSTHNVTAGFTLPATGNILVPVLLGSAGDAGTD